ncbi:MAG: hypothetical protein UU34_C0005G0046 [Candidatus Curtissbacteria bacterium GW2011_GWA1_41_11]|uniref:Uncharacterized protein n=1 Tax=Candidatus Curtissbacteria bacterium GW2011_GWA1_41_11 TaxID=1618409 RepID=A0A0G0XI49_9BACT|nr:MAG: hypothetical protein UU34_C0005G0046 [Candidatus Curtissbacteria bacterium GW2011_GWA1_41_11]
MLTTDLKHSGTTDGAFAFERRFTVFHRDFCCIWVIALRSALYAIHSRHK